MTDTLITPETARIAKEKGFNNWETDLNEEFFGRPTQSLLQKWLREEHGILVEVQFNTVTFGYRLFNPHETDDKLFSDWCYDDMWDYEEALEKGLQEGLKLI